MTVQQFYDYAKTHNALDYEICGTSIQCGPHFDVLKVNEERKVINICDGEGYRYLEHGFDFIQHRDKKYEYYK